MEITYLDFVVIIINAKLTKGILYVCFSEKKREKKRKRKKFSSLFFSRYIYLFIIFDVLSAANF